MSTTGTRSQPDPREIEAAVRERYRQTATSGCDFPYPTGRSGAEELRYAPALIQSAPAGLLNIFCGVGNPFQPGRPEHDETVLDIGCGGGFDLYCASQMVGPEGRVFGLDLVPEMVARARKSLRKAGIAHVRVEVGRAEALPFAPASFDRVISNGVFNMSPDKPAVFAEIHRVLKPGGRLQFADLVREREPPPGGADARSWSE